MTMLFIPTTWRRNAMNMDMVGRTAPSDCIVAVLEYAHRFSYTNECRPNRTHCEREREREREGLFSTIQQNIAG